MKAAKHTAPCEHIPLDSVACNMANHPDQWYWCRACRHWVNGRGQIYGQVREAYIAAAGEEVKP